MTAVNGTPGPGQDIGALATLPGLEAAAGQLAGVMSVLRTEQARRQAGIQIHRPAWRNLVFAGGPGTGKSCTARAVACTYYDLGLLAYGQLIEIAAADLAGTAPGETGILIGKALKPTGDLLMITDAHTWHDLPDGGQHVLRCLYRKLTEARTPGRTDQLAIILAGQARPLRDLLRTSPALAACFPAIIDFPATRPPSSPPCSPRRPPKPGSPSPRTPPARPLPSWLTPKPSAPPATPGSLSASSPRPLPARPTGSPPHPREPRPAKEPGQQRIEPELRVDEDRMARPDVRSVLTLVQVSPPGEHWDLACRHGPPA